MKLIVNRKELDRNLRLAGQVAGNKDMYPILQTIYLSANKTGLIMASCNLNQSIQIFIKEANILQEGSICLPASYLIGIIRELRGEEVEINCQANKAFINSDGAHAEIMGIDSSEFPALEEIEPEVEIQLSADKLATALRRTLFSTGDESYGFKLNGICLEYVVDQINFISLDGLRLSLYSIDAPLTDDSKNVLVPIEAMKLVMKSLGQEGVTIRFNDKKCLFRFENIIIATNVIDSRFPEYIEIIPKDRKYILNILREDMGRGINLINAGETDLDSETRFVAMEVDGDGVRLSGNTAICSLNTTIRADYDGPKFSVKYNIEKLRDILSILEGDIVIFEYNEFSKPVVIKDLIEERYLHLIAPIIEETEIELEEE